MILDRSILFHLAGSLVLTQVSHALPQSKDLHMRDDNDNQAPKPLSDYFGQSGMPEAKDLDAFSIGAQQPDNYIGVSRVPQILLGFLHINPFWVTQWFPDASQTPNSENTTLPSLTGYVLAFDKDKNERIPILTDQKKPNMLEKIIKPWTAPVDASASASGPGPAPGPAWWPSALLDTVTTLPEVSVNDVMIDLDKFTLGVSGHKVIAVDERGADKLWDEVFSQSFKTPMWIETQERLSVVMQRSLKDKPRTLTLSYYQDGKQQNEVVALDDEFLKTVIRLTHLEGFPNFKPGLAEWKSPINLNGPASESTTLWPHSTAGAPPPPLNASGSATNAEPSDAGNEPKVVMAQTINGKAKATGA